MSSSVTVLARCLVLSLALAAPARAADADVDAERTASASAEDILVTGARPTDEAVGATKTATPIAETPQSISVISRAEIDARAVQNLNQALQLTAGITPDQRGVNAEVYDQFKLRGFDVPQYLDGLRLLSSPTGYAVPQIDLSRLDRIEVVKGPSSVLYGQSSPGGLVAMTSKLPDGDTVFGSVEGTYGTFDLYRLDVDVGGPLANGVSYRAYGSVNGADTQQTFGKRERRVGSLAVAFDLAPDTRLTVFGSYSHDPFNGNYGAVPRLGSLDPNPNGRIPRDFFNGDPTTDRFRRNQAMASYIFDHRLNAAWSLHLAGRYTDVTSRVTGAYIFGTPADASLRLFGRGTYQTREFLRNGTFDNQLVGRVATGAVTHDLLFGVDVQVGRAVETGGFGAGPAIDAYAPVYGVAIALPGDQFTYDVHQRQVGLYAQDQLSLGGLRLTASGRYDWARNRLESVGTTQDDRQSDGKFTYRLAALYKTDLGLAPYVSYATSFQPQSTRLVTGDLADPSTGRQWEVGAKYQPPGTPILLSGAWFDIVQANVVVSDPLTFASTQSGRVRSRGFELEAKVPLFRGFTVTGTYSRQKVRTLEDVNPANVGRPLIGTARENGGLFGLYTAESGPLAGFGLGGAVRYVGRGYGGSDVYTPSYTLFDAVLSYDLGRAMPGLAGVTARVNATNLFDRRHITSCYISGVEWCWYGTRRTVTGTIGFRW